MIREATLMRTADRVTNYIEKYVTRIAAEKMEEVVQLFDNMHQVFPEWVVMPCFVMHPNVRYVSKNCPMVFGYSREYIVQHSSIEKFFPHVHEADQQDLHESILALHDFLESFPPEDHHKYRFILHYRFRKENGQYIYMHDEKAVLNMHGQGNLYYGLFRDVTAEKRFSGVKVEVYMREPTLSKIKEFKPSAERNSLSKREEELVTLMKQGLSTKEIAWYLKISHNTVRNIKSKMFEKFNVNNSIELLNMTA